MEENLFPRKTDMFFALLNVKNVTAITQGTAAANAERSPASTVTSFQTPPRTNVQITSGLGRMNIN